MAEEPEDFKKLAEGSFGALVMNADTFSLEKMRDIVFFLSPF